MAEITVCLKKRWYTSLSAGNAFISELPVSPFLVILDVRTHLTIAQVLILKSSSDIFACHTEIEKQLPET